AEELLGTKVMDLIPKEDHNSANKRIETVYKGRETVDTVLERFIRRDGKLIDVEVMATPVNYRSKPASQAVLSSILTKGSRSKPDTPGRMLSGKIYWNSIFYI
ncbi:MAG: PAS domain S-box protein, partial [bacterium]|nr:PAS domain S-box protein [bacterium]